MTLLPLSSDTVSSSEAQPRAGTRCLAPGCDTLVVFSRFCDGCLADAAKDCARQIEARLIAAGFPPGSEKLKSSLVQEAASRPADWYVDASILGELRFAEAIYLRGLTESACLLLANWGVAGLAHLPGTRHTGRPLPVRGRCNFKALPQAEQTEPGAPKPTPLTLCQQQARYNAYAAAVLLAMLVLLILPAVRH